MNNNHGPIKPKEALKTKHLIAITNQAGITWGTLFAIINSKRTQLDPLAEDLFKLNPSLFSVTHFVNSLETFILEREIGN